MFPGKKPLGDGWHNIFTQIENTSKSLTPKIDKREAGAQRGALVSQQVVRRSTAPSQVACLADGSGKPGAVVTLLPPELTASFHLEVEKRSDNMRYIYFVHR